MYAHTERAILTFPLSFWSFAAFLICHIFLCYFLGIIGRSLGNMCLYTAMYFTGPQKGLGWVMGHTVFHYLCGVFFLREGGSHKEYLYKKISLLFIIPGLPAWYYIPLAYKQ